MKTQLSKFFLSCCFFFSLALYAQNCPPANEANAAILAGNNYRARFKADGNPLWSAVDNVYSGLIYDDTISGRLTTIFAHGIWLGGLDPEGELHLSANTYTTSGFAPGPLGPDGLPAADNCSDFDRAWSVRKHDIETHLADYADNQTIDNPIPAVMGWPGRGNPDFFAYNDFELPAQTTFSAPYFDANSDGIYTPTQGDFPVEPQQLSIAEHLVWTVSNTLSGPASSNFKVAPPFPAQLETTAWALACSGNVILNDVIFTRYKITNLSGDVYNDVRFGLWTDFDLGCYNDDYIGIDTLSSTYYTYNGDNFDDDPCDTGVPAAGENPPVQSVTFLNEGIDAFMSIFNAPACSSAPAILNPINAVGHYNYLNARWSDGSPLQFGGSGYDQGDDAPNTNFIFSGNPNNPDDWTMFNNPMCGRASVTLPSSAIEDYGPGATWSLDVAYAYHREEGADHLGNINSMLENVAELKSLYDTSWENDCTPITCEDDCIFAGDLNADGIANYVDLVALSFGWEASGPQRTGPYVWAPRTGEDWEQQQAIGPNQKHLDANGDGIINEQDYDKTRDHYNLTRVGYAPLVEYNEGPHLQFVVGSLNDPTTTLNPGQIRSARVYLTAEVPNLQAVSFELEYDTAYFAVFNPNNSSVIDGGDLEYVRRDHVNLFECVAVAKDPNYPEGEAEQILRFILRPQSSFPDDFPTEPTRIRFRNVRGWLADGTEINLSGMDALIDIEGVTTSLEEPVWAAGIQLYPNPVSDLLRLDLNGVPVDKIELIDAFGRVCLQRLAPLSSIDLSSLPTGAYWLRLSALNGAVVRKVMRN